MAMVAYMLVDARNTASFDSACTVRDRFSLREPSDEAKRLPAGREVPPIYDIALEKVNRTLYADPRALADELLRTTPGLRKEQL